MTMEDDMILECSNELYKLAKGTKDIRWKRELAERAREIGDMRDATEAMVSLKNLVVDADRRLKKVLTALKGLVGAVEDTSLMPKALKVAEDAIKG